MMVLIQRGMENKVYQYRQGRAALYGGELSIDIHPIQHLHFENSVIAGIWKPTFFTWQTGNRFYPDILPDIPPVHGISELQYDFTNKNLHLVNGFVKVGGGIFRSAKPRLSGGQYGNSYPGYTLINAGVGAGFTNKQNKVII